ncbi:MAG: hypothetical protein WDO17_12655 [Alphaproteobacteria bacterium]
MPPKLTPEEWAQVRYAYEHSDKPVGDICADHGISPNTLRDRMRRWGWTRRRLPIPAEGPPQVQPVEPALPLVPAPPLGLAPGEPAAVPRDEVPPDPAVIVPRLQVSVARVLPAIEAIVAKLAAEPMPPREMERAARTLTSLTRTLRELNDLLSQHQDRATCDNDMPEDADAVRNELARRIEAFLASRPDEESGAAGVTRA